jgi:hypothetical protein
MNQFGTDVLSVAMVVGGAVVAGGTTLLLASSSHEVTYECSLEVVAPPRIVVALGGAEGSIVVAPVVESRTSHGCAATVAIDALKLERVHFEVDRARAGAEQVRERVERGRERAE